MEREMANEGEAIVVCSDKNRSIGITIWDINTGDQLLHIPTCASPPRGFLCLKNQFLFATQTHKHGSVGGGSIFIWPLNKPQSPIRNYPLEAIGPLCCTRDGAYLAGGAQTGNFYIWEVASGNLIRTWHAHDNCLTCMMFTEDGMFLISGSDDGMVFVWNTVSLLDLQETESFPISSLAYMGNQESSITCFSTRSGISTSIVASSSINGICKVIDFIMGKENRSMNYYVGITSTLLHPTEELIISGAVDGRIFVNELDIYSELAYFVPHEQQLLLQEHKGAITALVLSESGLVSASQDCTICIWDPISWTLIRKFDHNKGGVSNLAVVPKSSLIPAPNTRKSSNSFRVCPLDKCSQPRPDQSPNTKISPLSSPRCFLKESLDSSHSQESKIRRHIFDLEKNLPAALEMKLETSVEKRRRAINMSKDAMEMNKHLQSNLLDMIETRLQSSPASGSRNGKKRKKLIVESTGSQGEKAEAEPSN